MLLVFGLFSILLLLSFQLGGDFLFFLDSELLHAKLVSLLDFSIVLGILLILFFLKLETFGLF